MKNKRVFVILFISLFLFSIFSAHFVSAQFGFGLDLRQGAEQVIDLVVDFAEPFLQVLLGGEDYTGLLLFERFLIFILLLSIIYLSLKNIYIFEQTPSVLWVVSVIVPLVAVRFIDYAWLNTILTSYQVLGIAIAGILPFIIYLFFLHNITENSTARKIGWIFFIVVYFGLWSTNTSENYAQVYFWTMLAALVFLLLDGTIHNLFEEKKWKQAGRDAIWESIVKLDKKLDDIRNDTGIPRDERARLLREGLEKRKDLHKQLRKV